MSEPRFRVGDAVLKKATRDEIGQVMAEPVLDAGEWWYRVQFARRREQLPESDLDPVESEDDSLASLAERGRWGRLEAFRRTLAIERIRLQNRSTVYSFKAQRILFQPHQYKPLLRFLDSLDRRLLIADEVGLGKTIEAGLILTELEARQTPERILVLCPSRLRMKWREELNRKFGQDFQIMQRGEVDAYLERVKDNPLRSRLRGVTSIETMRSRGLADRFTSIVDGLDLLVVDEAHYARNPSTLTSRMISELGAVSGAMLMLTATPLHLGSRDLFTLLQALRPTEFRNYDLFDADLTRYRGVLRALSLVRSHKSEHIPEVIQCIRSVFQDGQGTIEDPLAAQVVAKIEDAPPRDHSSWIDLERRVDSLHLLSGIVTRTRKRDVQEKAPRRRSRPWVFAWTDEEEAAYQALSGGGGQGGWPSSGQSLGQIQRARQAASCLPAAMAAANARRAGTDDWEELIDIDPGQVDSTSGDAPAPDFLDPRAVSDTKLANLLQILAAIEAEEPGAKVLIFTYFVGTSKYLHRELHHAGWNAVRIAGDVPSTPHRPETDERGKVMARFEADPSVRVMVSTEVGSEGLDFQFCHHVVNYDLPWNPMVVEQRIGRIDRFGQESDVVHVHTLVVAGTVEDLILRRLYERIGIFERSIGDMETILGEAMRDLQRDYIAGRLSAEEAEHRVEEAARAIEQRRLNIADLERRAGDLFGHEDYIKEEMGRVSRLGRYLSPQALLSLVEGYLHREYPDVKIKTEEDGVYSMPVPDNLFNDVQLRSRTQAWDGYYKCRDERGRLRFTMDGEMAFRRRSVDLLNVSHPLVVASVDALSNMLEDPVARIGHGVLRLDRGAEESIPDGLVHIAVFAQEVRSIRRRRIMETIAWSCSREELLESEEAERLLHVALGRATEWEAGEPPEAIRPEAWLRIESEARSRNRKLKQDEQEENDATYYRRTRGLQSEFDLQEALIGRKTATAREAARGEQVLRMFDGQLAKARQRFNERVRELETSRSVEVSLSDPLALCAIEVRRGD